MPCDAEFHLPFPEKLSPDAAIAESHVIQWFLGHGLLRGQGQAEYFAAMRPGTMTAYWYPDTCAADLNLATDCLALIAIINDQVGSASGQRTEQAIKICNDLLSILQHDHPDQPSTPYGTAWCELWERMTDGMSVSWQARFRRHLAELLNAYLKDGMRRTMRTVAQHLERRRVTAGLALFLDLAERVGHFELPEPARTSPVIRDLFEEANKLFTLPHDVFAVEREEARGEVDNMVLVLEHATGRARTQVIADIQAMVHDASERFLLLESHVPTLYTTLALGPSDQAAVAAYVQAMKYLCRGIYDWQRQGTARYDPQAAELAVASGYEDPPLPEAASAPPSTAVGKLPRHLAVIPDGNRRWARVNGVPLAEGFRRGTENFAAVLDWCSEAGIEVVSLWLSSPDNIVKRPEDEVTTALRHTAEVIGQLTQAKRFRLHPIGNLDLLPTGFTVLLHRAAEETAGVRGMTVNLAAAYSGTQDLLGAIRVCLVEDGPGALTEERIEAHLSTHGQPPVDLLLRTSGEQRLSGFMPWQTADTELYFTDTPWPEFTREDLHLALADYGTREQRRGA